MSRLLISFPVTKHKTLVLFFPLKNPQLSLPSNSSTEEGNLIELCMFSNYRVVRNKKPGSLLTLHPVHSSALWYFLSHPLRLLIITTWTLRIYTKGTLYTLYYTPSPHQMIVVEHSCIVFLVCTIKRQTQLVKRFPLLTNDLTVWDLGHSLAPLVTNQPASQPTKHPLALCWSSSTTTHRPWT